MQSLARPYATVRCAYRQDGRKADDPIFALQGSETLPARCLAPFHISQSIVDVTHPNLPLHFALFEIKPLASWVGALRLRF